MPIALLLVLLLAFFVLTTKCHKINPTKCQTFCCYRKAVMNTFFRHNTKLPIRISGGRHFICGLIILLVLVWCRNDPSHLNRDKIESNLSVPGIQRCHENALYKNFEISPQLIYL